jgi:hypothetical protein
MREQVGPLDIWGLHLPAELTIKDNSIHIANAGMLKFAECERPTVGRIIAFNEESAPVLLQEGLIIEGLRQSRMVAFDQIMHPESTKSIDVVCVEEGRWSDEFDGDLIHRAPISVIAALRKQPRIQSADITGYRQKQVWSSVVRHQSRTQSMHTTSLSHMVHSYRNSESYFPFVQLSSYQPRNGQSGLVVSALGEPVLMEIFGNEFLFTQHFESIIQSVLWDLDDYGNVKTSNRSVIDFLARITSVNIANSESDFYQVIEHLSLKITHKPNEQMAVHSLAINHNHPIFA